MRCATYYVMRQFHVRALQTGDDWRAEVHALHDRHETLSNSITTHDAAKDVDEDGGDFGIGGDEVKGLLDGLRSGAAADVEEVGRLAAVELDDVHGGHGEAGAVDWNFFKIRTSARDLSLSLSHTNR